nr:hypothetical protein [uncultured Sulfurimonas sp.]
MSKNMTKISLLIDNEYIESFMQTIPKDKVIVIEEDFQENKQKLQTVLQEYKNGEKNFVSYYESMKDVNNWLTQRQ